jgi:hypothetical protein
MICSRLRSDDLGLEGARKHGVTVGSAEATRPYFATTGNSMKLA